MLDTDYNSQDTDIKATVLERIRASEFETRVKSQAINATGTIEERTRTWKEYCESYAQAVKDDIAERPLPDLSTELAKEHGLTDHPRAGLLFDMAYERCHSLGMEEVALEYGEMAELLK